MEEASESLIGLQTDDDAVHMEHELSKSLYLSMRLAHPKKWCPLVCDSGRVVMVLIKGVKRSLRIVTWKVKNMKGPTYPRFTPILFSILKFDTSQFPL